MPRSLEFSNLSQNICVLSLTGMILAPALLWAWVFYHSQRYKHTHLSLLLVLFIGGFVSGMVALVLNHLVEKYTVFWPGAQQPVEEILGLVLPVYSVGFWWMVGVNEEFAKLVLLLLVVYPSKHLEELFDGILYVAVIALGFATVENWFYLEQYGISVIVPRSVITLPAHAFMSVPMGLFVAKSRIILEQKRNERNAYFIPMLWILVGWLYSTVLHGTFDLLLSLNFVYVSYALVILMGLQCAWFGRRALNNSKLSPLQVRQEVIGQDLH